ncbi:MAG: large conductance mechanosensitive channel [Gammaproteobacteria bacterium]|jgi:large conductance mechanosensitive channel
MIEEFKKFILRGNVLDMAVGIVIGAAFGAIVTSFVADVIMPPIGLLMGGVDFTNVFQVLKEGSTAAPYASLEAAKEVGAVTINWGLFINTLISFIIIALAIFMVVKAVNKMQGEAEEEAAADPSPDSKEVLLTEIRDLLKK